MKNNNFGKEAESTYSSNVLLKSVDQVSDNLFIVGFNKKQRTFCDHNVEVKIVSSDRTCEELSFQRNPAPKSTAGFAPRIELATKAARKVQTINSMSVKTRAQVQNDKNAN
jgi:hypothetical protein